MKAYLVDPSGLENLVTEIQYDGTLKSLFELLGADGIETSINGSKTDLMFVDKNALHSKDIGAITRKGAFAYITEVNSTILYGKALIVNRKLDGSDPLNPIERLKAVIHKVPKDLVGVSLLLK